MWIYFEWLIACFFLGCEFFGSKASSPFKVSLRVDASNKSLFSNEFNKQPVGTMF